MTGTAATAGDRTTRRTMVAIALVAVAVLAVGLVVGWTRGGTDEGSQIATALAAPVPAPELVLTSTDGEPYRLAERFEGRVTLLYLGYLNCPDACPITMDVLSRALATRAPAVRSQVQVVFVTTDPDRDRPDDIRAYLDRFDPSFVGLTASPADLERLQVALQVPAAIAEPAGDDGDYLVGHATSVFLFDEDGVARLRFGFGTRQADWERVIDEYVDA